MEAVENLKQKLEDNTDLTLEDMECFKEHLAEFLEQENFLEYLNYLAPLDIEFVKSLILNKTVTDEEFVAAFCFAVQDDTFFEKLVIEGLIENPVWIAEYQELNQGIGKNALLCIRNLSEAKEKPYEIQELIRYLKYCHDITFKNRLDAVYYYTKAQDPIDIDRVKWLLKGVFENDERDYVENPVEPLVLTDEDIDAYESLVGYIIQTYTVNTYFTYQALKNLENLPYFQEQELKHPRMIKEMVMFFNRFVDLSQKENQLLSGAVIGTYWQSNDVSISERLKFMEEYVSEPIDFDPEVCVNLLHACYDRCSEAMKKEEIESVNQRVQNIILQFLENQENIDSATITSLAKILENDYWARKEEEREEEITPYARFVLTMLQTPSIATRLSLFDKFELVDSTRNAEVVRFWIKILEQVEEKTPGLKVTEVFNGNLVRAIIHTRNKELILEEYQKGNINFKDYMPKVMEAQGVSEEEIIARLDNASENIDEDDISILVCMLKNKEIAKSYIEKLDLSPFLMSRMISSVQDESYSEAYLRSHEDIDIHLKYLLAYSLKNKDLITQLNAQMMEVNSLAEISLEELENYEYVMIRDADRDVYGIIGFSEIYTKEKMIQILAKAEELLKDIPYASGGDLIEDSIIFKRVYESYAFHSEYDDEAVSEAKKNDWRRHLKCRNFEGGILEGLAVCSGDAFCFKNLLSLRGVKAYTTHGDDKYRSSAGHAWNTIRLGDMYFKFDGTAARRKTKRDGYLSMDQIKKEHGENDEYQDEYVVSQSYEAMNDERNQNVGKKKVIVEIDE